jgi:ABC-type multidrug transport system ATPase subunit
MDIYEQVNQQILPRKFAVMAHSHIGALSSEMPRKLTIVAQLIRDPAV